MDANGITVDSTWMSLKFPYLVATSSISNEHFRLFTDVATPVEVSDPWLPIDVPRDYESISRTITLNFKANLVANTGYILVTTGLKDPAGRTHADYSYHFTTGPSPTGLPAVPDPEPTFVDDQSIISDLYTSAEIISAENPDFYIKEVVPSDLLINADENDGRIIVKFSSPPASQFLNANYFKLQRKLISATATRWLPVSTHISIDGEKPWVYIDLPSIDATPVFHTAYTTYFETGYKYRLKISKDVGT